MGTLLDFLKQQSILGAGSTVAELINNPRTSLDEAGLGIGNLPSDGNVGAGSVGTSGAIAQGSVPSEGSIGVGTLPSDGSIDPA